jgi:anti-sigma factor RsiW
MSAHEHLSDDAFLDALYGLTDGEPHLRECPMCAQRLSEWRRKRESLTAAADVSVDVSSDFLAAQRRKIYERLERPEPKRLRWAPALAMACLVAVGVLVYHPATPPAPQQRADVSDSQLFSDAYSMDQSLEPSAAAPIHALFEDGN